MTIKIDIGNQVRQTALPQWKPLLPLFEAVMNSFQAIKEAETPKKIPGRITIEIERQSDLFKDKSAPIDSFKITDNGVRLDDDNFDSCNTAFSRRKSAAGGKGLGRFTWLKAFERAEIESIFRDTDGSLLSRSYTFSESYDLDTAGLPRKLDDGVVGTTVRLFKLKKAYRDKVPRSVEAIMQKLIEHFILILLEPDCPTLTYHSFIASDKQLRTLDMLKTKSALRGDIVIFDEKILFADANPELHPINSITTIEFKRPGRDDYTDSDNPLAQSFKLIDEIRSGQFQIRGRPVALASTNVPASIYCICDLTPTFRRVLKVQDAFITPDNQGYYGFHRGFNAYYEIVDYTKMLRDAKNRNRIFFEKLNVVNNH
ncbi:MAG: ATP-binding protein [Hyphomonadaceae bacterium]